ncbi:hypothetical protein BDN67DRAFT_974997 [Paxillus ammoniavirescens]|nr:hypothetical protein BDN67DRAFT_974997 [Paxillus ammoniavirescens]
MKTFLTLLAAITSLSAYTLVGVHANCAVCPTSIDGRQLANRCIDEAGTTICQYEKQSKSSRHCYYKNGAFQQGSNYLCPDNVEMGNACPTCP